MAKQKYIYNNYNCDTTDEFQELQSQVLQIFR